eukprot:GHVP01051221.1.p1 GENE.GHVP01051221.1~~GHVP01051221.1.p1  ORF type:complete len:177 (+),score=40.64 GHVP01051221.1:32-532(+)
MTFEVDLFKLSEDTKAIFLQLVDFSTDDEVPRRNFSTSELTFHMGCLQSKEAVKEPSEVYRRFENSENFCEVQTRTNPPEMKGEDSQGTTNKVAVKKPISSEAECHEKETVHDEDAVSFEKYWEAHTQLFPPAEQMTRERLRVFFDRFKEMPAGVHDVEDATESQD